MDTSVVMPTCESENINNTHSTSDNSECVICLEPLLKKKTVRTLKKCKHQFHKKCVRNWIKTDSGATCPICRGKIKTNFWTKIKKFFRGCKNCIANGREVYCMLFRIAIFMGLIVLLIIII